MFVDLFWKVFWKRCRELTDYAKIMEKIEKGEKRIFRSKQIRTAIDKKVSRHANPWQDLTINYYGGKVRKRKGVCCLCSSPGCRVAYSIGHWSLVIDHWC